MRRIVNETCTDCGAPATCKYDYGTGMRHACAGHDPLRSFISAAVRVPAFYQSLAPWPVQATTGHLGIVGGWQHQNIGVTPGEAISFTVGASHGG